MSVLFASLFFNLRNQAACLKATEIANDNSVAGCDAMLKDSRMFRFAFRQRPVLIGSSRNTQWLRAKWLSICTLR